MNEKIGEVFSITKDNEPIQGCTTSKAVNDTLTYFSLARNTDISAEIYPYYKMIYVLKGQLEVYGNNGYTKVVKEKESFWHNRFVVTAGVYAGYGLLNHQPDVYVGLGFGVRLY